jgi:hypothetical protein
MIAAALSRVAVEFDDDPGFHAVAPGSAYRIISVDLAFDDRPGMVNDTSHVADAVHETLREFVACDEVGDYRLRFHRNSSGALNRWADVRIAVDSDMSNEDIDALIERIFSPPVTWQAVRSFERNFSIEWDAVASDDPYEGEIFEPNRGVRNLINAVAARRGQAERLDHVVVGVLASVAGDDLVSMRVDAVLDRISRAAQEAFGKLPLVMSGPACEGVVQSVVAIEVSGLERRLEAEGDAIENFLARAVSADTGVLASGVARLSRRCDAWEASERMQATLSQVSASAIAALTAHDMLPASIDVRRLPARLRPTCAAPAPGP